MKEVTYLSDLTGEELEDPGKLHLYNSATGLLYETIDVKDRFDGIRLLVTGWEVKGETSLGSEVIGIVNDPADDKISVEALTDAGEVELRAACLVEDNYL